MADNMANTVNIPERFYIPLYVMNGKPYIGETDFHTTIAAAVDGIELSDIAGMICVEGRISYDAMPELVKHFTENEAENYEYLNLPFPSWAEGVADERQAEASYYGTSSNPANMSAGDLL